GRCHAHDAHVLEMPAHMQIKFPYEQVASWLTPVQSDTLIHIGPSHGRGGEHAHIGALRFHDLAVQPHFVMGISRCHRSVLRLYLKVIIKLSVSSMLAV